MAERVRKVGPTAWWYIAALFGGVLIGALGDLAIKDDEPGMANRVLIVSLVPTVVAIILILTLIPAILLAI